MLYHFLLVRFYPYIHEQEYFDGLFISNKVLLSQMLLKEFRKYYGEDTVRSVVWSFDLIQVFLSIFKAYNELSTHLLHLYYKFKTKDLILTTTNSARTGYFHEALSTGKEAYAKELSNRPSRSILTGRSGDSQPSFRDSLQQGTDVSQNDIKLEHLLPLRGNNVMKKSMGTTVKSKSPIRNNVNNNKENKNNKGSEGMRRVNLSQRVDKSGGSTQRDLNSENSMISESQRSNYKINNQRQRSVEVVPAANPQSLRKALNEVDENYMKKLLRNDSGQNLQGKKPSGIIENIEKFEAFSSRKSSAHENITMSIEAFPGHTPIQSKEMKYASLKVSKPPLKSNANSSVKSKPNTFSYKMNYESFNPRYHEIPSQMTESEDISPSSVKEREIKASEFLAKGKILTITDESLLLDEKSVNISEVNKLREQNNRSWQQEKSILENVVHGKSSRDYREEKDEADISMENNEPVHMRINDVRRASLASQKSSHFSEDAKAMKNKDILEIFNKLESKIYDVKTRPSSRFEDNYTSGSFVKVNLPMKI